MDWLDEIKWDRDGLVPVIAQERGTGDVLMFAWMNREALARTAPGTCSRCTRSGSTATTTSCCSR
jgi:phosphoribosyl-AMP cyclohydrolase